MKQEFLQAAKLIDSGEETFSCSAVFRVSGINLKIEYARLASPRVRRPLYSDDIVRIAYGCGYLQTARNFRVLLLLMIGAAYKDIKEK